jgi:hypothetical protein
MSMIMPVVCLIGVVSLAWGLRHRHQRYVIAGACLLVASAVFYTT